MDRQRRHVPQPGICTRARYGADRLAKLLLRRGYAVKVLDDHPSQSERELGLEDLRRGRVQILVASDASARSLDLAGVSHVVNFDVPQTPEDYVHRLGRGGRAEPVGDAFTLMSPEEQKDVAAIERLLGRAIPRVLLPDFDYSMRPSENRPLPAVDEELDRTPDKRRVAGLQAAAARIAAHPIVKAAPGLPAPKPGVAGGIARASNGSGRFVATTARPAHGAGKSAAARPPVRSRPPGSRPAARTPVRAASKPARPARVRATRSRSKAQATAKRRGVAHAGGTRRK